MTHTHTHTPPTVGGSGGAGWTMEGSAARSFSVRDSSDELESVGAPAILLLVLPATESAGGICFSTPSNSSANRQGGTLVRRKRRQEARALVAGTSSSSEDVPDDSSAPRSSNVSSRRSREGVGALIGQVEVSQIGKKPSGVDRKAAFSSWKARIIARVEIGGVER